MSHFLLEWVQKGSSCSAGENLKRFESFHCCTSNGSNTVFFFNRGKDHLFFQENSENIKDISPASHHRLILPDEHLKANPLKQQVSFPTSADPDAPPGANKRVFSLHNPATKDLLSGLYAAGIERCKEK